MRRVWIIMVTSVLLCSCGYGGNSMNEENTYMQITQDEAKKMMDEKKDILILDVREQLEYDEGHVPGAVLLPVDYRRNGSRCGR